MGGSTTAGFKYLEQPLTEPLKLYLAVAAQTQQVDPNFFLKVRQIFNSC
jgi:hypothetical protein